MSRLKVRAPLTSLLLCCDIRYHNLAVAQEQTQQVTQKSLDGHLENKRNTPRILSPRENNQNKNV